VEFFDVTKVEDRLKLEQFGFEVVGSAADYASVTQLGSFRPGSVYVVLVGERNGAGENLQGQFKTPAVVTFGVVIAARNYRGSAGGDAAKELSPLVGRVRKALIGWAPDNCTPCRWLQGDVMDYDKTNILWCDVFTTTHILGST
jgi:hypothetical protein